MVRVVKGSRPYDASGRQERARQTQLAVLHAAQRLFVEQGYGRTTLAEVAQAAGVSVETIYATFKNKKTLLHRVWDITVGGDDQDIVLHERPEVMAMRAEPDLARRLMMQAEFSTATARRMTPLIRAVQGAAASEPAAADMLAEIGRQRLVGIGVMAREAAATGQLAVTEEECRDVVWAFTDGTLWHQLVEERGWSDERYAAWLGAMWVRMLVRQTRSRRTRSP